MSDLSLYKTCLVTAKSHKKRAHEYKREALEEYAKGDVSEYNRLIKNEFYVGTWDGKSWIDSQFRPIRIQHIATHYAEIPPLEAGE